MNKPKTNPCIECGGIDIKILNCGYSSFNAGHAKCRGCGREINENNFDDGPSGDLYLVKCWNKANPTKKQQVVLLGKEIPRMEQRLKEKKTLLRKLKKECKSD